MSTVSTHVGCPTPCSSVASKKKKCGFGGRETEFEAAALTLCDIVAWLLTDPEAGNMSCRAAFRN